MRVCFPLVLPNARQFHSKRLRISGMRNRPFMGNMFQFCSITVREKNVILEGREGKGGREGGVLFTVYWSKTRFF